MDVKLSVEEQLRIERQQRLALQAENEELSEVIVNQLLDLDFRQSLNELEVDVNDL